MAKRTSVYLTDTTLKIAGDGESLSGSINRIIDRYGEIVRRTRVEEKFNAAEVDALRDVANGWLAEPAATIASGLALEVEDAGPELGDRHGIDRGALLAKLRALTYAEEVALVEGIERYWRSVSAEK